MLGVFSGEVVEAPAELVAAGSRTPSPKTRASELVSRFVGSAATAVSVRIGSLGHLAYSHSSQSPFCIRSFAAKEEIFCLFDGMLDNLGKLRQQYGLSKSANEAVLLIEAYKALRDRAPYPPSFMLGHLAGSFTFVLFDKATSTLLVASDPYGKVPLFWGITADGCVAFASDLDLLKGACGKSLAPFPQGCFYSNALGGLKSFENPKNKVTAELATDEEICGATFKVNDLFLALKRSRRLRSRSLREQAAQEIASLRAEVERLRSVELASSLEKGRLTEQIAELVMQRDDGLRRLTERCTEVESLRVENAELKAEVLAGAGMHSAAMKENEAQQSKLLHEIARLREHTVALGKAAQDAVAYAEELKRKGSAAASRVSGRGHSGGS